MRIALFLFLCFAPLAAMQFIAVERPAQEEGKEADADQNSKPSNQDSTFTDEDKTLTDKDLLTLRDALSSDLRFGPELIESGIVSKFEHIEPGPDTVRQIARLINESGVSEGALAYLLSKFNASTAKEMLSLKCGTLSTYHRSVLLYVQVTSVKITMSEAEQFLDEWHEVDGLPLYVFCCFGDESRPGFRMALSRCLADPLLEIDQLSSLLEWRYEMFTQGRVQLSELALPTSRLKKIRDILKEISKVYEAIDK